MLGDCIANIHFLAFGEMFWAGRLRQTVPTKCARIYLKSGILDGSRILEKRCKQIAEKIKVMPKMSGGIEFAVLVGTNSPAILNF